VFEPESRLASLKLDDETKVDTGRRRQLGLGQAKLPARRTQMPSDRKRIKARRLNMVYLPR